MRAVTPSHSPKKHARRSDAKTSPAPANRRLVPGICVFLTALVFLVFGQTGWFDFVNFDDEQYVTDNPAVMAGITPQGIASAFGTRATDNWVPLTTISHMVDCQLYGVKAGGHHWTNVLLHATAVVLLFLALYRMTGAVWRSAVVAAVFAVHPLRAESVAWVSERKDVLCGAFFTLTLWMYAHYARNPKSLTRYLAALVCAALAIMSKPVAVTLPFVLLLLDYWPLNRFSDTKIWRLVAEKIPFLVLSLASCLPTILTERQGMTTTSMVAVPLRIENAIVSTVIYIRELFYPSHLAAFYYYPISGLPHREVALALIFLGSITLAAWYWRRRHPYLLVGWLWYLVMLVPVIGLVQVGSQAHADRHTYLSEIGVGLLLTWLAADLCTRWDRRHFVAGGMAAAVIVTFIFTGRMQVSHWKNGGTLWAHALDCDPNDVRAYYNLANYLEKENDWEGAKTNYEAALRIDPQLVGGYNNLGMILASEGHLDDAIREYREVIRLDTNYAVAYYNLGSALLQQGATNEAVSDFQLALSVDPARADAQAEIRNNQRLPLTEVTQNGLNGVYGQFHDGLGIALQREGQIDEAITQYREALKLNAHDAEVYYNLGSALLQKGETDEAISDFQLALSISPSPAEAGSHADLAPTEGAPDKKNEMYARFHDGLGAALQRKGQTDQAIAQYQEALKLDPGYSAANYHLADTLLKKGKTSEGITQFQEVLKNSPDDAKTHNNLGSALRREGQMDEAIIQYREALKIDPAYAPAHFNLGNVLLQKGKVNEAIGEYLSALKIKPDNTMVQNNIARATWTLAVSPDASVRNGTNAVEFAKTANDLAGGNNPMILRVLAAAYAESGNFSMALDQAKQALALATQQENLPLENALQQEISLYQDGKAMRAGPDDMNGW